MQTTGYAPPADPTAIFGRRTVAFLIDLVIGVAIMVAVFASLAESADMGSNFQAELTCDRINEDTDNICIQADSTVILAEEGDVGATIFAALVYGVGAYLILPALTGGTLGKLLVGIRVVDKDTFARAGFGKHLVRWILWVADTAPWFCGIPLVGLITGLSSKGHRRVGDMAAGTLVVDKKMVDHPVAIEGVNTVAPAVAAPGAYAPPAPTAPPPPAPMGVAPPAPTAPPPPGPAPVAPPTPPPTAPPADWSAPAPPTPPVAEEPPPVEEPTAQEPPPVEEPTAQEPPLVEEPTAQEPPPVEEPTAQEPAATEAPPPPETPPVAEAPPPPVAEAPRPGIDAPQWDQARNTYIQWDPELEEWMEWSEAGGRWIPISR